MYLLDTNACIDYLDGRSQPLAQRMAAKFGQLAISAITAAELLVGNKTSTDPAADARRLDIFVASVKVLDFGLEDARTYGMVIRTVGIRRKSFDRLIGTQAARAGATLVTRDAGHFGDVPGLAVEDWTQPL